MGPGPFLDPTQFGWIGALEAGHGAVRGELEALLGTDVEMLSTHDLYAAASTSIGGWQTVLLHYYGLDCGILVSQEVAHWVEGRSLVFDESSEHEAWNRTDGMRAALLLDVVRPLRQPARAMNAAVLAAFAASPYARSTKRRNQAWEAAQGLTSSP